MDEWNDWQQYKRWKEELEILWSKLTVWHLEIHSDIWKLTYKLLNNLNT